MKEEKIINNCYCPLPEIVGNICKKCNGINPIVKIKVKEVHSRRGVKKSEDSPLENQMETRSESGEGKLQGNMPEDADIQLPPIKIKPKRRRIKR